MEGNAELLGDMGVPVAGWIGDDRIGLEESRALSAWVGRGAGSPARFDDLLEHLPLLRHVFDNLVEVRRQQSAPRLHHVGDQDLRVAAEGIELKAVRLDKVTEDGMGSEPHPMAIAQQALSDGDKGLDVTAGANNEDGNLERRWHCADADRLGGAFEVQVPGLAHDTFHFVGRFGSEVDRDAFILAEGDGPDGSLGELARPELQHAVPEERSRRFFSTCRHVFLPPSE